MVLQVGQRVEVVAGGVAQGGWCVARPEGLPVMFIRHALPGERVIARVTEVTSKFARAEAVEISVPSPDRVAPPCPSARPGGCGGCDWQHASLPAQRALKAEVVSEQLRRLVGIDRAITVEPLPGEGDGLGWRTRAQFAVRDDGVAGLRAHRSHEVIDIGDCPLVHPRIRALAIWDRDWTGAAMVEVATGNVADRDAPDAGEGGEGGEGGAGGGNLAVVVTPATGRGGRGGRGGQGRPAGRRRVLAEGRPFLTQRAAGRDWRVSAEGFWQVHPAAADTLVGAVLGALEPGPGDTVLDLYCGAGLFAGAIAPLVRAARPGGADGAVTGIESDEAAVRDARHNLRDYPWARVRRGDVARAAAGGGLPPARLVVADPPRAGLAREVTDYLIADGQARRFAYVSCDPATLARDLGLLAGGGWALAQLRAFDAFPMTHHVECVATLTR